MKLRYVIVVIIYVLSLLNGYSQDQLKSYFEFGGKVSKYSMGTYVNDSIITTPFAASNMGVRMAYVDDKNMGVIFEMTYNRATYNKDGFHISYSYLHFPLFTHIHFPIKRFGVSIDLGPYGMSLIEKDKVVLFDNEFLYGIGGGVGVDLNISKLFVGFDGRFYFNLPSNSAANETLRNQWFEFSLSLGWRKHLKKSK